jgi:hypothetical protein
MPAQTVIKLRRDTAADWTSVNPVLAAGEAGFESDTNKLKIGDGVTAWTGLSYASGGGGVAIDEVAPDDTEATPLWWDTATGTLYIYYDSYWVEAVVGQVGPQGIQGEVGPEGPIGETGPAGPTGETGPQGPQGIQGIQGETGPAGADGGFSSTQTVETVGTSRALASGDAGKLIINSAAITITVQGLSVGQQVDFLQNNAAQITFTPGSGITLNSKGGYRKTLGIYSAAGLKCIATNSYILVGDLAA